MRKHAQPDFVDKYGSHNIWQRQEKSTIRLQIDGQNSIKVSRTFLQGLLLRRIESRQTYRPSITEAKENNTKAPGQQKKKLETMGKLQKHSFPTRIFHRYE